MWNEHTRFTADMIYGSGLRSGDFNLDHVPGYAQVNVGVSHEFNSGLEKPATIRFDVHQPVRQGLRDPRRLRHRRLCSAIRTAPRVLGRPIAEILSARSPPVIPGHCPASRAHWDNFRFLRPVKISGTFRRPYRC
jgi:hypothetical protein